VHVDLRHSVFVSDIKSVFHRFFTTLDALRLLQRGTVDVLFFYQGKHVGIVKQLLQELVEFSLLVRKQRLVENVSDKHSLEQNQLV
jgi:uncharacterized membrane protein